MSGEPPVSDHTEVIMTRPTTGAATVRGAQLGRTGRTKEALLEQITIRQERCVIVRARGSLPHSAFARMQFGSMSHRFEPQARQRSVSPLATCRPWRRVYHAHLTNRQTDGCARARGFSHARQRRVTFDLIICAARAAPTNLTSTTCPKGDAVVAQGL